MLFIDDDDWLSMLLPEDASSDVLLYLSAVANGLVFAIILFAAFYGIGHQHRVESGGTRRRLLLTSLTATAWTLLPGVVGFVADWWIGGNGSVVGFSVLLAIVTGVLVAKSLVRPVQLRGRQQPLDRVEDESFLDRVQELAGRMQVATPVVRLLRSPSAEQVTLAYVGGIQAPCIVVTDGLLTRLDPEERDAIICHELAHLANRTLWWLMALAPLAAAGSVLAMACGVTTWMLVFPALMVGFHRLMMRPLELDCDLRAARAMGFPEITTALQKIHRLGLESMASKWLRTLIFATDEHPALSTRLAYVRSRATRAERGRLPDIVDDEWFVGWWSAGLWLAVVAVGCWLGRFDAWWAWGVSVVLLLAVPVTPPLLIKVATLGHAFHATSPSSRKRELWTTLVGVGLVGLFLVLWPLWMRFLEGLSAGEDWWMFVLVAVVGSCLLLGIMLGVLFRLQGDEVNTKLQVAWRQHEFARVIELLKRHSKRLMQDPNNRSLGALARAALGDQQRAIAEFEGLIADFPQRVDFRICLASLNIEVGAYEQALAVGQVLIRDFPDAKIGAAICSRALRRLGRLDEAQQQIEVALKELPDDGSVWAAAAGVAIDRGELERARDLLETANVKTPGTPQELVEAARLSIKTEPVPTALQKLRRAIAALEGNPLMLRQSEILSLRKELAKLKQSESPEVDSVESVTEVGE